MKLSDFDYNLPSELIAQTPASPRDHSRLLVLHKETGEIEHQQFFDLKKYLKAGDVLVLNNTKVFPARLLGKKVSGGKAEVFLLKKLTGSATEQIWQCLLSGLKGQQEVIFEGGKRAEIVETNDDGTFEVKFIMSEKVFWQFVNKHGRVPLPPYIKTIQSTDKTRYQTVFAEEQQKGSVAAPTAGLHFTKKLINDLKKLGVQFEEVTLHVGLGTFASVKTEDIKKHQMHAEWYEVDQATVERLAQAKQEGRRIITVGTTATRTLETVFSEKLKEQKGLDISGYTSIFIYPGYKFKIVSGMITNFHVPKSTLLMLVSALAQNGSDNNQSGLKKIRQAYEEAKEQRYRFFSYGDAMLIV